VTVVLKPLGRGNWSPLLVRVGECIVLAGITFRVCEVRA